MKTLWLSAACFAVCVMAVWCSRTTYGEPPKALQGTKMISVDDAILDANEILFVDETQTEIRIGFRGLPTRATGPSRSCTLRRQRTTGGRWLPRLESRYPHGPLRLAKNRDSDTGTPWH